VTGVTVTTAAGEVAALGDCASTSASPGTTDCDELAAEINDRLDFRMKLELPMPEMVATPKGAFAGFQQNQRDFLHARTVNNQGTAFTGEPESRAIPALQLTVINDSDERSRLILQFAAIQANSIYTISKAPEFGDSPDPLPEAPRTASLPDVPDVTVPTVGLGSPPDLTIADPEPLPGEVGSDVPATVDPVAVAQPPVGGTAFLVRSRGEALSFALLWLLLVGAAASAVRRQSLLRIVAGKGVSR
jgi:hypothetical protein